MSVRKLVQRPSARRDTLAIVAYIAAHNPSAAGAFLDAYQQALLRLRTHPEAGRRYVPDHAALGTIRVLPIQGFADYLIFSRFDGSTVEVVRVIHGARDILAVLQEGS